MLGAERTVEALRRGAAEDPSLPAGWTVLPHGAEDVREFLAGLDFYLYLDNPRAHEAFGRTLLEAAASGVLTIAHPKHEPTFGPTLDYAEPGEAQQLVARYRREDGTPKEDAEIRALVLRLHDQFPGDIGVFCAFLLNVVHLQPGEAIFLGAGEPHAYISGGPRIFNTGYLS